MQGTMCEGATPRQAGVRKTWRKLCPARQVQGGVGVGVGVATGSARKNIQDEDKQLGQGSSEVRESLVVVQRLQGLRGTPSFPNLHHR